MLPQVLHSGNYANYYLLGLIPIFPCLHRRAIQPVLRLQASQKEPCGLTRLCPVDGKGYYARHAVRSTAKVSSEHGSSHRDAHSTSQLQGFLARHTNAVSTGAALMGW